MDKILEYFIKEPEKEFHVRQLSKLLKRSPTSISKYLKEHEHAGVLKSEKKFNHLFFRANPDSKKFRLLKLSYNLNLLEDSGVISEIVDKFNEPEAIVLFGSLAKSEDIPQSDIDLLIISPLKKDINLEKFEKKVGHKIQVFVHSKQEIEKMRDKSKELLNNFINGIVIYGFWEVFK